MYRSFAQNEPIQGKSWATTYMVGFPLGNEQPTQNGLGPPMGLANTLLFRYLELNQTGVARGLNLLAACIERY